MKVNGRIIKCMEKESSHGLTAENMKVTTLMTRSKVREYLRGQMEESMTEIGSMASSMEKEFTIPQRVMLKKESGKKEKEQSGFQARMNEDQQLTLSIMNLIFLIDKL
jgi:hypothetical protein